MKPERLSALLIFISIAFVLLLSFGGAKADEPKIVYITSTEETETISETTVSALTAKTVTLTRPTLPPETIDNTDLTEPETEPQTESTEPAEPPEVDYEVDSLLSISSPDAEYQSGNICLSTDERANIEAVVNGEFGNDYIGACLIAQAMRDAIVYGHAASASTVINEMGYYGYNSDITETARQAVSYIFDCGGVAVPHKILVMYNPAVCGYQPWHESQEFVLEYGGVRFFSY